MIDDYKECAKKPENKGATKILDKQLCVINVLNNQSNLIYTCQYLLHTCTFVPVHVCCVQYPDVIPLNYVYNTLTTATEAIQPPHPTH